MRRLTIPFLLIAATYSMPYIDQLGVDQSQVKQFFDEPDISIVSTPPTVRTTAGKTALLPGRRDGSVEHLGDYSPRRRQVTKTEAPVYMNAKAKAVTILPSGIRVVRRRRKKTRSIADPKDFMKASNSSGLLVGEDLRMKRVEGGNAVYSEDNSSPKMHSPRLQGSSTKFLKNKLLDNLNRYFSDGADELEILAAESKDPPDGTWHAPDKPWSGHQQQFSGSWANPNSQGPPPPPPPPRAQLPPENPWLSWTTPPSFPIGPSPQPFSHPQPALPLLPPLLPQTTETPPPFRPHKSWESMNRITREQNTPSRTGELPLPVDNERPMHQGSNKRKQRGESPGLSSETASTIRKWRTRLYKAFKGNENDRRHRKVITRIFNNQTSAGSQPDLSSTTDRRVELLHSRDQLPHDRRVRNYGGPEGQMNMENNGFQYRGHPERPPTIIEHHHYPAPPTQRVVYMPAPTPPPSQGEFSSQPFPTLSMMTYPTPSSQQFPDQQQSFNPNYQAVQMTVQTPSPTLPSFVAPPTLPPTFRNEDYLEETADGGGGNEGGTQMRGVRCAPGTTCDGAEQEAPLSDINEDKCNSARLKKIIETLIVPHDAEASKRAVQSAAEGRFGRYFDAICGTGFFSYIAHTDEFCQASANGVNCYVFSPVCGGAETPFKRVRKHNSVTVVNRN